MRNTLLTFTLFVLTLTSANAYQMPLAEADTLKHILYEIEAINPLIEEAQKKRDKQSSEGFQYRCLIADLGLVKHGIRSAIYGVKHLPNHQGYRPLCGEYGYVGVVGESKNIQMLLHEIQSLRPLILKAKKEKNPKLTSRLNYDFLRGDLDTILSGLQHALMGSGKHKRAFPPLRGKGAYQ
jgi:RAQPRD family integrative conjugative element protein